MSFAALRKNSKTSLESLSKAIKDMGGKFVDKHEGKFWKPTQDKLGNASAIIRFLPQPDGEELSFVKYYEHSFQTPSGRWVISKCPTTIGKECYVCDKNQELWETGVEANQDIVRDRKRKTYFVSNVLVISDPKNPEAEGKVFVFRYGKKIMDKILEVSSGPKAFEDDVKFDPFNAWSGANFRLRQVKKDGFPNFDQSKFDTPSALFPEDAKIEAIWKQEHSLKQFIAEDEFPASDALKEKFERGMSSRPIVPAASADGSTAEALDKAFASTKKSTAEEAEAVLGGPVTPVADKKTTGKPAADADDDFFNKLLEDK